MTQSLQGAKLLAEKKYWDYNSLSKFLRHKTFKDEYE